MRACQSVTAQIVAAHIYSGALKSIATCMPGLANAY